MMIKAPVIRSRSLGQGCRDMRHTSRANTNPRRAMVTTNALVIPDAYGYVLGSISTTALVVQWMSIKVALARRESGVKYPKMMADGDDEKSMVFNCTQRSHQNTLETVPLAIMCQALMGLKFPIVAAVMGFVWAIGRIIYANGYSSGDPAKRMPGAAISGIVYLALIIGCFVAGFKMVVV